MTLIPTLPMGSAPGSVGDAELYSGALKAPAWLVRFDHVARSLVNANTARGAAFA